MTTTTNTSDRQSPTQPFDPGAPRPCATLFEALFFQRPVRMVVRVVGMETPSIVDGSPSVRLTLQPIADHASFQTQPITSYEIVTVAMEAVNSGAHLEVIGHFPIPQGDRRKRRHDPVVFQLDLMHEVPQPSALVSATDEELAEADRLIDEHAQRPGGMRELFLGLAYQSLGAVTAHRSPRLRLCETAVLLQVLSHDMVGPSVNGRLSLLLASRPGASKKLMGNLSLLLSPLGQMVQPTMVSLAGLSARVDRRQGGWFATPGALPSCSGGALVMEDMHRIPRHILNAIQGCLMGVAEDGKVVPTKAATANYFAFVALHMSTNLQSVVHASLRAPGIKAKLKDLGLPFDLLSRIDMIIDMNLGDNAARQACAMVVQKIPKQTQARKQDKAKKERLLKVLVARLLDRFEEIDLTPAEAQIEQLMKDVALVIDSFSSKMSEEQQMLFDCEGLLRRISNSIRKLVSASARLNCRDHVTQEDVDTAWDLLSFKLEIIRWICDDGAQRVRTIGPRQEAVHKAQEASEARWTAILQGWAGEEMALCDIAEELELSVRTVAHDLEARGYYPERGWCKIPTLAEEAERRARVARGEPLPEPPEEYTPEDYHLEDPSEGLGPQDEEEAAVDRGPRERIEPEGELAPLVNAMKASDDGGSLKRMQRYLFDAVFSYSVVDGPYSTQALVDRWRMRLWGEMKSQETSQLLKTVTAQLNDADPQVRQRQALRLIVHSGNQMSRRHWEELLAKGELGEAMRDIVESIIERLRWEEDQAEARWQRKKQEEAAAKEKALWEGTNLAGLSPLASIKSMQVLGDPLKRG